jgi:carboxypeptidase family protein/TonB-dependent receptor-like protein
MTLNARIIAVAALVALMLSGVSYGQRTTATFAGILTDPSGAVLPGAEVQLINEGTNAVTTQLTSEIGEFLFDFVPAGTYTLKISLPGFKTYESRAIPLGAAQNVRRPYALEVGNVTDNVTVTGEAPLVNTLSAEQRNSLETVEVNVLPIANRNITSILDIASGLTKQETTDGRSANRFQLNGLGGSTMSVTANGVDANGNAGAMQLSGYFGFTKISVMSTESVAEVQIIKGVIPAEYGSALSGNLSLITKSGTNEWHGSLFHRYEGSVLSARPQFLTSKNNSVWNQFGGSLGGPIKKNRDFFFVAYEGYRQRTSLPVNVSVPTPRFRDIMLTSLPYAETKLLLDYYPLPNQPYASDALLATFIGPGPKEADDDHVDAKVDTLLASGNLSLAYASGHPYQSDGSAVNPLDPLVFTSRSRRVSLNYVLTHGAWTSSSRAGYNVNWLARIHKFWYVMDPKQAESTPGWRRVERISYPGMSGLAGENQTRGIVPSYSFEQQFAYLQGKHSWKFGGMLSLPAGGRPGTDAMTLSYLNLQQLMANQPNSIVFDPGKNDFTFHMINFGFFLQDDWRVNRKLVLNLGVRYDRFGHFVAKPLHENQPAGLFNLDGLRNASTFDFGPLRDPSNPHESDNLSIAPRFGFAYTLDQRGDFVLRGGFGVNFQGFDTQSYESRVGRTTKFPSSRTFTAAEVAARGWKYPMYVEDMAKVIEAEAGPIPQVGNLFDPHQHPPYAMNFTLGIQRALTPSLMFETAFVGSRGVKLTMVRTYNQPDRVTGIRPNPNLGQAGYNDGSQQSVYYSWQSSLRQRLAHGLLFNAHYTWGKALSYTGGDTSLPALYFGGAGVVEDFDNVKIERGPSAGDTAHNFVSDVVYTVPTLFSSSRVASHILGGWSISGIWKAQTGIPITITQTGGRPDLLDFNGAINKTCCSFGNLQYLNRAAFQAVPVSSASGRTIRRGNIGNNGLRRPGFTNLDLSLAKNVSVGERRTLELRADMLNAFNQTQYTAVSTNLNSPNFGQVTGTAGARTIQLQARFAF